MKTGLRNPLLLALLMILLILPKPAAAADFTPPMKNYCITPPFITAGILPNLLLMIDNSASMFDLAYVDTGCPTCTTVRKPKYCFDNTYKDKKSDGTDNDYAGYFDKAAFYNYDMTGKKFVKVASFPSSSDCNSIYLTDKLCVNIDSSVTPGVVTRFAGKGNYLNWMTASKFDVEKKILTGGKWESPDLVAESRGCVGRGFVKQPLSTNSGNFVEGGTNTSYPISMQIKGLSDSYDSTSPSQGGETEILFYKSSTPLDYAKCDEAITLLETTNSISSAVKTAVAACIGATGETDLAGKSKQIFQQSLQECWQYFRNSPQEIQGSDYLTVKNFCTDVYNLRFPTKTSTNPASGIQVGDADLLCSDNYVGACYSGYLASLNSPSLNLMAFLTPKEAFAASPGTIQLKSATYTVNENGGIVTLLVSRTGGSDGKVDVNFTTADGTATAGSDYVANSGTLSWNNNSAVDKSIVITIKDDALVDANETFTVTLSSATGGATLGATKTATVTIADNDVAGAAGTISFETAAPGAVNETAGSIVLLVQRLGGATGAASVSYTTANVTALAGSDYTTTSGTLSWADGNSDTKTITIPILRETPNVVELNETFTVTLSGVSGAALGSPTVSTVTITESTASAGVWPNSWSSDACVKSQHEKYCGGLNLPPVIDPTNVVLDQTSTYVNLPAVIADVALAGQMGAPLKLYNGDGYARVRVSTRGADGTLTTPTGIIQSFGNKIRVGLMSFNYNGSTSECAANSSIPCPKICSNDTGKTCSTALDCCSSSSSCECLDTIAGTTNADGAKMEYYVGQGTCSNDSSVKCTTNDNCTLLLTSGTCNMPKIAEGTHSGDLVNRIDGLRASSWTPFSEAFYNAIGYFAYTAPKTSRTALRINPVDSDASRPVDFAADMNPSQFLCQQNFVLLVSDGVSTADQRSSVTGLADLYKGGAGLTGGVCPDYKGSSNLPVLSWLANNRNISNFSTSVTASTDKPVKARDKISTYVVFNGQDTGDGECNSRTMMRNSATLGGGKYYDSAGDPKKLELDLRSAFDDIVAQAASGTAASILSNSEGSGANILQAVFYPEKNFAESTSVRWVGEMQNLWYFVDPYVNKSTIREDTLNDFAFNLKSDYVVTFPYVPSSGMTMAQRYIDSDGDGSGDTPISGYIDPDDVQSLWRAGKSLWERTAARDIRTSTDGSSLTGFSVSAATSLAPYLGVAESDAGNLINWVHGTDSALLRPREVSIKPSATATPPYPRRTWKLGDIISSTPRVQSSVRLNTYNLPYPGGYNDKSYETYITSSDYKKRGMVYVGANDGLFHAFYLGQLKVESSGSQKATLTDPDNIGLGKEIWSFIPKNVLPYLKYIADPAYTHFYAVDGRTAIFDASIGYTGEGSCIRSSYDSCDKPKNSTTANTWRTVVIGGMGLGGASRPGSDSCTDGKDGTCVKTPITDPLDASKGLGYSSYFALDVTSPMSPTLLWEYSNPELGYSTTGPAIVRIGDANKNGKWYAIFGSGPTGPIDTDTNQFLGRSDQNLKFFVVDLQTGHEEGVIDTGVPKAFAGALLGASIDVDRNSPGIAGNYQDDALYVGYTKADTSVTPNTWTKGGVGRIVTKESATVADWRWSKVIDDIGPVTTAISRLQDSKNRNLWLFFGTGRFYYRDYAEMDDRDSLRSLYGVKEPCYNTLTTPGNFLDKTCSATISSGIVDQSTTVSTTLSSSDTGWKINLDPSTTAGVDGATISQGAERVVTDTVALTNGTVFFTSFKPSLDLCGYGGNSFLWGVKYDTGGQAASNALKGKALIQLSTGEFKEVDLATAFTDRNNRRMADPMTGKPPSDAPPIISSGQNKPVKKILHIREH